MSIYGIEKIIDKVINKDLSESDIVDIISHNTMNYDSSDINEPLNHSNITITTTSEFYSIRKE